MKFAKSSRIPKPRYACKRPAPIIKQWDLYNRKGRRVLCSIQKNCKKWSGSPDWGDRLWPAKSPLERSRSVSGYPTAVTGVLKRLIVSTVGKASSIKVAKPRVHHTSRRLMALLSSSTRQGLSLAAWGNLPGLRKRPSEMLRHCLWHRVEPGSEMAMGPGHYWGYLSLAWEFWSHPLVPGGNLCPSMDLQKKKNEFLSVRMSSVSGGKSSCLHMWRLGYESHGKAARVSRGLCWRGLSEIRHTTAWHTGTS